MPKQYIELRNKWSASQLAAVIRWLIFVAAFVRLIVIPEPSRLEFIAPVITLSVLLAYNGLATLLSFHFKSERQMGLRNARSLAKLMQISDAEGESARQWCRLQIVIDTVVLSVMYWLVGHPDSNFYLFYFVPILIAAGSLKFGEATKFFCFICLLFTIVLLGLEIDFFSDKNTVFHIMLQFFRDLLPRTIFFFVAVFFVLIFMENQRSELEAIYRTSIMIADNVRLDRRLSAILDAARELLNTSGCKVYLPRNDEEYELVALAGIEETTEVDFNVGYIMRVDEDVGMAAKVVRDKKPLDTEYYPDEPYAIPALRKFFGGVVEVPLFFRGSVIGVLGVFDRHRRKFSAVDVNQLERLARYAAVAIRDSELVEETQKQADALVALNKAGEAVNSSLDLNDTLHSIARHAFSVAKVYVDDPLFSAVWLLDRAKQRLSFRSAFPEPHNQGIRESLNYIDLRRRKIGVVGRVAKTGKAEIVPDVRVDKDFIDYEPEACSLLAVPLKGRGRLLGVLDIEHSRRGTFPEKLIDNLELFSSEAATAIENSLSYERLRKLNAEKIEAPKAVDDVAKAILLELQEIVAYDRASFQRIDYDERTIIARIGFKPEDQRKNFLLPVSEDPLVRDIVDEGKACILKDTGRHPHFAPSEVKSWIGMPLLFGGNTVGFITVDSLTPGAYSKDLQPLLELFARHAASNFQNAVLLEELARRIDDLTEIREFHEALIEDFADQSNLARIGLVYGETVHFAKAKLGIAKTLAADISAERYDKDTTRRSARRIRDNISSYLEVLNEMHKLSIDAPKLVAANVHTTLEGALRAKNRRISRRIEISREYAAPEPIVMAPEGRLKQVFLVILDNALDAMRDGEGCLFLGTRLVENKKERFLEVSIADTGRGMSKKQVQNLFIEEYQSGKKKGSGMGLQWAYAFIRSYGGTIECESAVGQGTTMRVLIPKDFRKSQKPLVLSGSAEITPHA